MTVWVKYATGEKVTSLWMRNVGAILASGDGGGQLKPASAAMCYRVGGDLAQWSTDGLDRWHIGAMAGYANSQNFTQSSVVTTSFPWSSHRLQRRPLWHTVC